MAIRVYDNGSLYSISVGEAEIYEFRRRWPASGLGGLRSLWAQYDKRNGRPPVEEWATAERRAWAKFAAAIKKSMLDAEKQFHEEIKWRLDG